MGDVPEFSEPLDHRRRFGRGAGHDDIEIPDRLLAAAEAARNVDFVEPSARLEVFDDCPGVLFGLVQHDAFGTCGGSGTRDAFAKLVEQLGAESAELRDLALLERFFEIRYAVHLQLVMEELHALGSETRNAE